MEIYTQGNKLNFFTQTVPVTIKRSNNSSCHIIALNKLS